MAVSFAVELEDKLSGPALEAAKGFDALVASFDKLKASAGQIDALLSKLPAPAKGASKAVDQVAASVAKVEAVAKPATKAVDGVTKGLDKTGNTGKKSTKDVAAGLKEIDENTKKSTNSLMAFAGAIAVAAAGAGVLVVKFGQAVYQAATLKSESIRGLEAVIGDKGQAKAFAGAITGFKGADSFDPSALFGAGRSLVGSGFSTSQAEVLVKSIADAASVGGNDNAMIGQLVDSFGEVQSKGNLDLGKLIEISKASKYSINADQVTNKIAEIMGTTADEARKALEKGQVSSQVGLAGIVTALRDRVGGGKVGGAAEAGADTLPGLVAQVQAKLFNLTSATEDTPGLMKMQGALKSVVELLDAATPRGKRLQAAFDTMVGGLFGKLLGGGDATATVDKLLGAFEGIAAAVGPIVAVLSGVGSGLFDGFMDVLGPLFGMISDIQGVKPDWMDSIVGAFKTLGKVVGWAAGFLVLGTITIVSAIAAMVAFVGSKVEQFIADWHRAGAEVGAAWNWIANTFNAGVDMVSSVGSKLTSIGSNIVDGLWAGISAAWGGFLKDFDGLVGQLPLAVRKVLGIASPAKVMMPLGGFAVDGIGVGAERAAPALRRRMENVVAPLSTITMPMLLGGGGARAASTPSITININAAGASREDADSIAERVRVAVLQIFRDGALMSGAT